MLLYMLILQNYSDMKILFKLSLRNEHEIRNDLPARTSFVVADTMGDAVNGYVDTMSLVQSVEFVAPVLVIPSKKTDTVESSDSIIVHPVIDPDDSFYRVTFLNDDKESFTAMVRAKNGDDALFRLEDYLGYSPTFDSCFLVDYLVL